MGKTVVPTRATGERRRAFQKGFFDKMYSSYYSVDMSDTEDREVRREYDNGTTVYAEPVERREAPEYSATIAYIRFPPDRTYWVETPDGRELEFSNGSRSINSRRGQLMGELWHRAGDMELTEDPDVIPVEIAVMGKPAMAAYLDTVHKVDKREIAEDLNVSLGTVEQYFSDFKEGRR